MVKTEREGAVHNLITHKINVTGCYRNNLLLHRDLLKKNRLVVVKDFFSYETSTLQRILAFFQMRKGCN